MITQLQIVLFYRLPSISSAAHNPTHVCVDTPILSAWSNNVSVSVYICYAVVMLWLFVICYDMWSYYIHIYMAIIITDISLCPRYLSFTISSCFLAFCFVLQHFLHLFSLSPLAWFACILLLRRRRTHFMFLKLEIFVVDLSCSSSLSLAFTLVFFSCRIFCYRLHSIDGSGCSLNCKISVFIVVARPLYLQMFDSEKKKN